MFEAKGKVEIFKRIVEIISVIVSEVKYNIREDGLHIKAVDPAHVAMVELNINPKAFSEYSASDTELGIDLDKLDSIIELGEACRQNRKPREEDDPARRLFHARSKDTKPSVPGQNRAPQR
jgi:proliferating cell nuclear antigen